MTNEAEIQLGVLCAELRKSKRESDKALAQQITELAQQALAAARADALREAAQMCHQIEQQIRNDHDAMVIPEAHAKTGLGYVGMYRDAIRALATATEAGPNAT